MAKRHKSEAGKLVAYFSPKSPVTEAYRILRTNIQFMSVDEPVKTLVVTSAGPQEGKTTTVSNLGITMAQSGSKVLLVDCDMRRPALHKSFKMDNIKGLTHILRGDAVLEEAVQITGIANLSLLSSGPLPPNPVELMGSARMRSLVSEMKDKFDMVVFDTPPAIAVADAVVLASYTDGVIMVINHGEVTPQAANRVKDMLENAKARILGVVLSGVPTNGDDSYYYYYYGKR